MLVSRHLIVAIDFHCRKEDTVEVNGYRQLSSYQPSLKYIILCSAEEKNFMEVWNNMRVSK